MKNYTVFIEIAIMTSVFIAMFEYIISLPYLGE